MTRANKTVYHPHGDADDFKTVEDTLDDLDTRVTQNETDIGTGQTDISTLQADMTEAQTDISDLQTQQYPIDFTIESPDNQDYDFELDTLDGYTINSVMSKCRSGTCTATIKIGGTALGGGANSVSATLQTKTHSSDNVVASGDASVVTISANSSCAGLRLVFWVTPT